MYINRADTEHPTDTSNKLCPEGFEGNYPHSQASAPTKVSLLHVHHAPPSHPRPPP